MKWVIMFVQVVLGAGSFDQRPLPLPFLLLEQKMSNHVRADGNWNWEL